MAPLDGPFQRTLEISERALLKCVNEMICIMIFRHAEKKGQSQQSISLSSYLRYDVETEEAVSYLPSPILA